MSRRLLGNRKKVGLVNKYLIFFVLVLFSNMTLASIPEQAKLQRSTGVFGVIVKNKEGKEEFKITNTVPLVEGQSYGWVIKLGPGYTKVKWQEVFELPVKPKIWDSGEASGYHEISENGNVSVMEKEVVVEDGYIQNLWSVAPGDPVGDYVIRVYVNDLLLETFHFRVVKQ